MFKTEQFIKACRGQSPSVVREVMMEALRDPEGITQALASVGQGTNVSQGSMGDLLIHRSPDLTILKAAVPSRFQSPPHTHCMWAVIGVYDGQENNFFYREQGDKVEQVNRKDVQAPDVVVMGEDAIHAIQNPLDRVSYAIHVYGGDLPSAARRMWNPFTLAEEPYTFDRMLQYVREMMQR
jgi:predicted metal-dependent enzyme (double-stranded beta helix superfamily)